MGSPRQKPALTPAPTIMSLSAPPEASPADEDMGGVMEVGVTPEQSRKQRKAAQAALAPQPVGTILTERLG